MVATTVEQPGLEHITIDGQRREAIALPMTVEFKERVFSLVVAAESFEKSGPPQAQIRSNTRNIERVAIGDPLFDDGQRGSQLARLLEPGREAGRQLGGPVPVRNNYGSQPSIHGQCGLDLSLREHDEPLKC